MPRIIVMSEPSTQPEGAITLDERVASTDLQSGHRSAQLISGCDDAEREQVVGPPSAN